MQDHRFLTDEYVQTQHKEMENLPMFAQALIKYPVAGNPTEKIPWFAMVPFNQPLVVRGKYSNPFKDETSRMWLELRFAKLDRTRFSVVLTPPNQNANCVEQHHKNQVPPPDLAILPTDKIYLIVQYNINDKLVVMQVS